MYKYFISILFIILLIAYFFWGVRQSEKAVQSEYVKEIIQEEKKIMKHVAKEKAKIYSISNANRNDILKLMQINKL